MTDAAGAGLRLEPSPGPDHAPASAAGHGLLTDDPVLATWPAAADGRSRVPLLALGRAVTDGAELRYAVFPAFDDAAADPRDGFRASAIAVDVVFDDGSRLLDEPPLDQYGLPADARSTFENHLLPPDQWTLRRIGLPAGRRAVALEAVVDTPAPRGAAPGLLRAWIDGAGLHPMRPLDRSLPPAEIADTRRGSHSSPRLSRGLTVPLAGVPHGGLFVHPVTDAGSAHWAYSWNAHAGRRPVLHGLRVSHTASIWMGDWGVLQLLPRADADSRARSSAFDHDAEEAHPHRYRVALDDGVVAEATATDHVAVVRVEFPRAGGAVALGTLGERSLSFTTDARGGILHGWIDGPPALGRAAPRMFVDARVDGPARGLADVAGTPTLLLDPSGGTTVELRIGTSLISQDLARRAREREAAGTFDAIRTAAQERWDALLGLIEVEGAGDDQLVTLLSSLARVFAYPNRLGEQDAAGETVHAAVGRLDGIVHGEQHTGAEVRPGALSTNHGFWDTYRTVWPALGLLTPESAAELLDGFVTHFRDDGWLPRWAAPGPVDAMVGTSLDAVLADALALGVLDAAALAESYPAALRDASAVPPDPAVGRKGMPMSIYRGFVADDVPEGMSWGLESALNDAGLFRLADALVESDPTGPSGDRAAERRWFATRAASASRYFDPASGFFRGLAPDGTRRPGFDPRIWGGDYAETNAWGMAVSLPHDGAELRRLYGGSAGLRTRLDAIFTEPETAGEAFRGSYPEVIHEMTEARDARFGMWGLSNQPGHHIPYLYLHAGHPAAAQRIVREALDRLFIGSEIGQGYPGDEDNGEMSAWWLFGALGLYPLAPGSGEWVIGSPRFERMRWRLPRGVLEVVAHRTAPGDRYVQAVRLDGEPWSRTAIPHARLVGGARLDVVLGPEPSSWGTGPADTPSSLSEELAERGLGPLRDALTATGASAPELVDDTGLTAIDVSAGTALEFRLDAPGEIELYTLGFVDTGSWSWRLEAATPGGWVRLDERHDEATRWPWQVRPFLPAAAVDASRIRLTALAPLRLAQLEALTAVGP